MKQRRALVDSSANLSIRRQADLLCINRSSLYYAPRRESDENLALMRQMDELFVEDPTLGVLGMQDELKDHGWRVNHKRVRRLMRKMGIEPIYPKRNLSRLGKAQYVQPYLLRGLNVERPNHVWAIDITYVPMKRGFMYLTAIIDVYSRYIVGWQVSNSLEKETQTEVLEAAIRRHGTPEIVNSDQGSQYTSEHWVSTLKRHRIKISMDGKGRATDNAFIERWFRSVKHRSIYLHAPENGTDLAAVIQAFVTKYNRRRHQGIDRQRPIDRYRSLTLKQTKEEAILV